MVYVLVIGAVLALGCLLFMWRTGRFGSAVALEKELRQLCHGDQALMERLIALETARRAGISRAQAVSRAVAAYRRDLR
jgi:hypothetical protein